jgi:hypothetical protein
VRPYRRAAVVTAAAGMLAGVLLIPIAADASVTGTVAVTPAISLTLSPATLDYGDQVITVYGAVTAAGEPVTGATVSISYLSAAGETTQDDVSTGSTGTYSGTISDLQAAAQTITATVAPTSATTSASASENLGFTQDQVTISAEFAHPDVNVDSPDVLSGRAEYVSDGAAFPLGGATLTITWPVYPFGEGSATVTTAANGTYSYSPAPDNFGAGIFYTFAVASAATAYLQAGEANASVTVNQVPQVTDFAGSLSPAHILSFDACGGIGQVLANSPLLAPVEYQYSKSPHGPWKTLGTGKADDSGSCYLGNDTLGDANYPAQLRAPLANAYYRAYAPAVPGQESAASEAIHLWKYLTRIADFKITPTSVTRNGVITVSGRLWELTSKWAALAAQKITIEYRSGGKTYVLRRLTTSRHGLFTGRFRVPHDASWRALFPGGTTQFASATGFIRVTV